VKAIVTGADCDKTFGVLPIARSEHPMARDKVRYRGEPVAAVAAVDDATAKRAIALIKLTVRELPAYYTSQAAMAEAPPSSMRASRQYRARRALRARQRGAGLPGADLVREGRYDCAEVCQNQMEMHAASPNTTPCASA
jgi:4-hydroxybenzoyl-CoA reductase subunit alpha